MVKTIIEDTKGIQLKEFDTGSGFIYDGSYYIKTDDYDPEGVYSYCVNAESWEIAFVNENEYVIPCSMELRIRPGMEI